MKRRADLQRRVIALLGEAFPGEIATNDDRATIDGYIDDVVASLDARHVIHVADADAIPDSVFSPLARLVAVEAGLGQYLKAPPDFRAPLSETTRRNAETMLREMQLEPCPGETVRAMYF